MVGVIMIFKRKKKYHILDRGLLAEAISIYSDKINLEKEQYSKKNIYPEDTIRLNNHLTIKITNFWHTNSFDIVFGYYLNYFVLNISTYVDGIKMAAYQFELNIKNNEELYRKWECKEKEIVHYMPNQFIDLMNEWSKQIVSKFEQDRIKIEKEEKLNKKTQYDREESMLNTYR